MAISATSTSGYNIYSLYNELYGTNSNASNTATSAGTTAASNTSAYSGLSSSLFSTQGREQLQKIINDMREAGYSAITFNDIDAYRKELEAKFTESVKADLAELGVDPEIEFTLVVDAYGAVQVLSDHADKAVVEQYLKANPEKVEEFKEIQAMANLKRSAQKTADDPKTFKLSLQAEAIQAFFDATDSNNADYFSQIANFGSNGAASYFLGLNQSV